MEDGTNPGGEDFSKALAEGRARKVLPIDVSAIRKKTGLSQERFARAFQISPHTLRNWEQGRRVPEGPARALLLAIDRDPEAVTRALDALTTTGFCEEPNWSGNRDLVLRFFYCFSRFEYALKAAGYAKAGRNGEALPKWDDFADADELGDSFLETMSTEPRAKILFCEAPRNQVWKAGRLNWDPNEPSFPHSPYEAKKLFEYVRRVRNNLFHGGKVPFDSDRDVKLINAALFVLEEALKKSTKVNEAFHAPGDGHE
ncbi:MAG: helix-turn-helix domain-containing protein [Alphaproteobacteria bacterium]|nr:helix-turn-helix domain-containing protein [Alphaproteobacteria bacterium]